MMFEKETKEWANKMYPSDGQAQRYLLMGAEFGYNKANEWHKITDWKDNSQFPDNECKTYLVRLYQDDYVVCELDITEGYREFYLTSNLDDIDPQDVIAWKEIVLPKETEK